MPRKILVFVFILSLVAALATGLALLVSPPDRVASWASWTLLGLSKRQLNGVHLVMSLLCGASGAAALFLNSAALAAFFKSASGSIAEINRALAIAIALTALVFLGTVLGLPPLQQIADVSGFIKDQQTKTYGEPPFPHAEEIPLVDFARRMGIPLDKALAALSAKNIRAQSPDQTLKDIGDQNGLAPGGVFAAVEFAREMGGAPSQRLPKDPPPGLGKRKISDICEEYELDIKAMLKKLVESGIAATPASTLNEVANANNLLPIDVYDAMRSDKPVSLSPSATSAPLAPAPETTDGETTTATVDQAPPPDGFTQDLPADMGAVSTIVPPPGLDKMMLGDFCKEFNVPVKLAVDRLAASGVTAFVDMTFMEMALENDKSPEDIMRIITTQ